jgi:hypothetical protein
MSSSVTDFSSRIHLICPTRRASKDASISPLSQAEHDWSNCKYAIANQYLRIASVRVKRTSSIVSRKPLRCSTGCPASTKRANDAKSVLRSQTSGLSSTVTKPYDQSSTACSIISKARTFVAWYEQFERLLISIATKHSACRRHGHTSRWFLVHDTE